MTDLAITTSQVALVSGDVDPGIAGEAITLGQIVYYNEVTGQWLKALASAVATAAQAGAGGLGFAMGTAIAAGHRIGIAKPGAIITLGAAAAPAAGTYYFVSPAGTGGGIAPAADITSGMKSVGIAVGIGSNNIMLFRVYNGGAVKP